ncbi:MAG: hypothetical protein GXX92_04990 [Clostridiales bacterium]|nr:hypothetical protein [Clostridiales bacterium]
MMSAVTDFHSEKLKSGIIIVSFAVLSSLLILAIAISTGTNLGQMIILQKSRYEYSATLQKPTGRDDYYKIDAGIGFALEKDSTVGLNADVLMQTEVSEYTDSVAWNAVRLGEHEIAISSNLARSSRLNIGDKLFSKHTVDDIMYEYTISQLLPFISSTNGIEEHAFSDGVIIMGYDSRYVDNISHYTMIFTEEPVSSSIFSRTDMPSNLIYREDVVGNIKRIIFPYFSTFALLSILITVIFAYLLSRTISHNFRRYIMLGFGKKKLDRSYRYLVTRSFLLSILITIAISLPALTLFSGNGLLDIVFLLFVVFLEAVALVISQHFLVLRIWRT